MFIPGKFNSDKTKMFFFGGQEYRPTRRGVTRRVTMPTALEQAGDFSRSIDANDRRIVLKDPFAAGAAFPNNTIPASRVDSDGQALMNVFPGPNFTDRPISNGAYNYVFTSENKSPIRTDTVKLDYNFNEKNMLFWTCAGYYEKRIGQLGFPAGGRQNWGQGGEYGFIGDSQGIATRYTRVFSPTVINEFHFGLLQHPESNEYDPSTLPRNQRDSVGFAAGECFPATNPLNLIPKALFGGVPNAAKLDNDGRWPFQALL